MVVPEKAGPSAEEGSAFVVRWMELLRSPWALQATTLGVHLGFAPACQLEFLMGLEVACWDPSSHELECSL